MNLQYLRYFQVLTEVGQYTEAAKQLYITQPALTNAIHALEEELGVPLFLRKGRRLELSPYGRLLLPMSGGCLRSWGKEFRKLRSSGAGKTAESAWGISSWWKPI